ncbi:hypothetical protein EZV73_18100 [Acidaminobacter sp. JC074]|uniref:hypothetical protein n=1 Tax=Acidaminobacter sp. JC074 TaxID=2530199 RepID=UPI001F10378D|nr:hypothetical protein [Acidaminobacter sp. JC074]MCH4889499.1 hypothetical protein [Acidaminobacter sp. JC074]
MFINKKKIISMMMCFILLFSFSSTFGENNNVLPEFDVNNLQSYIEDNSTRRPPIEASSFGIQLEPRYISGFEYELIGKYNSIYQLSKISVKIKIETASALDDPVVFFDEKVERFPGLQNKGSVSLGEVYIVDTKYDKVRVSITDVRLSHSGGTVVLPDVSYVLYG